MFTNSVGLLFLCTALQVISTCSSCEPNCRGSMMSTNEKWEYTLVNRMLPWIDAFQACEAEGKKLVSIESLEVYDNVLKLIKQSGNLTSVWTSGTDLFREGEFTWMNNGKRIYHYSDSLWGPGQPDNGGRTQLREDCIEIGTHWGGNKLNDIDCASKFAFICQKEI